MIETECRNFHRQKSIVRRSKFKTTEQITINFGKKLKRSWQEISVAE